MEGYSILILLENLNSYLVLKYFKMYNKMQMHINLVIPFTILFSLTNAKDAIILGSSGLVGGLVLEHMLASPNWDTIHVIVRKPLKMKHTKINELLLPDLTQMTTDPQLTKLTLKKGKIDAAVVTLGVNTPFDWTLQQLLDVEVRLTSIFAQFCHSHLDVKYISLLSGVGTEREYKFSDEELATKLTWWNLASFYPYVKGNVEDVVVRSGIPYKSFFRPANFETDEYRFGTMDMILQWICAILNPVIPSEYHSIHVNDIARAMFNDIEIALEEMAEVKHIVEKDIIKEYDDMIVLANKHIEQYSG